MRVIAVTALFIVSLFLTGASTGYSQTDQPETPSATGSKAFATPTPTPSPSPSPVFKRPASLESHFVQHIFHDQVAIWTGYRFIPAIMKRNLFSPQYSA